MELKVKNLTESPFQAKQNWRKLAEKVRKWRRQISRQIYVNYENASNFGVK